MKKMKPNNSTLIVVLFAILALPVAYYFLYALPQHNKGLLELEEQKLELEAERINIEAEQAGTAVAAVEQAGEEAEAVAQAEEDRMYLLTSCLDNAEANYNYVKENNINPQFEECNDLFYNAEPADSLNEKEQQLDDVEDCLYILDGLTEYNDELYEESKNDCYLLYD